MSDLRALAEAAKAGCSWCGTPHKGEAMHHPLPYKAIEASPDAILALLDRVEALEATLDVLVGMCETGGDVDSALSTARAALGQP